MSRSVRILLTGIGALLALVLLAIIAFAVIYSPAFVTRMLLWQDADVDDHLRFPARSMEAADEPYRFAEPDDPVGAATAAAAALEGTDAVGGDLDRFLGETDTQALIVIRDGEVLLERYVGEFERDSIATSFSTAKSFLSALVGIAIGEGAIGHVDDPITEYLPELLERDERFGRITIRHLLNMASGIHYEEGLPAGDDTLTYYFDDLEELALGRTVIDEPPGERWLYNNYHPLLLGLILERTTGMSVTEYLEQKLWQPMGAELDGSWSLDSEDGLEKLESGINARPIDFAKLGQLYLDGGVSPDGTQVVPADWVELSTAAGDDAGDAASSYPPIMDEAWGSVSHRMFWWHISRPDGDEAFSAVGNFGQYIFVSPADGLVIVRSGEQFGIPTRAWFELFVEVAHGLGPAS